AKALAHLLHSDEVTIIQIAAIAYWHFKVEIIVARIRVVLAYVIRHARRAKHRPGHPPINRLFACDRRHALRAVLKDGVVGVELMQVVDVLRHALEHFAAARNEILRQVGRESADSDITHHHAHARCHLKQVVNLFARLERVPEIRDRAEVYKVRAYADHVIHYARQLAQYHANVGDALGH